MDQTNETKEPKTEIKNVPATPQTPPPPPATLAEVPPVAPETPKKPVWPWILGGCLILLVLFLAGIGILGWLGVRSVKNMIKQYEPTINQTQQNIDKINQEASKWQETSRQMRDSLPGPEELEKMQADMPNP